MHLDTGLIPCSWAQHESLEKYDARGWKIFPDVMARWRISGGVRFGDFRTFLEAVCAAFPYLHSDYQKIDGWWYQSPQPMEKVLASIYSAPSDEHAKIHADHFATNPTAGALTWGYENSGEITTITIGSSHIAADGQSIGYLRNIFEGHLKHGNIETESYGPAEFVKYCRENNPLENSAIFVDHNNLYEGLTEPLSTLGTGTSAKLLSICGPGISGLQSSPSLPGAGMVKLIGDAYSLSEVPINIVINDRVKSSQRTAIGMYSRVARLLIDPRDDLLTIARRAYGKSLKELRRKTRPDLTQNAYTSDRDRRLARGEYPHILLGNHVEPPPRGQGVIIEQSFPVIAVGDSAVLTSVSSVDKSVMTMALTIRDGLLPDNQDVAASLVSILNGEDRNARVVA